MDAVSANEHPRSAAQSDIVLCNCDVPAPPKVLSITLGKQMGRRFHSCDKPAGQGCGFFVWIDSTNEAKESVVEPPSNTHSSKIWDGSAEEREELSVLFQKQISIQMPPNRKENISPNRPKQQAPFKKKEAKIVFKKNALQRDVAPFSKKRGGIASVAKTLEALDSIKNVSRVLNSMQCAISERSKRRQLLEESVQTPERRDLKVALLPHQDQGVSWMELREKGTFGKSVELMGKKKKDLFISGGIIGDDCGLGKTLQTIALILRQKNRLASRGISVAATLIICPKPLLAQWGKEASKFVRNGALSIHTHYGSKRAKVGGFEIARDHDIVITTFSTVLAEASSKQKCKETNKHSKKTKSNCEEKIAGRANTGGLLQSVEWNRIVLDEGHVIRNANSKTAKAVFQLKATHRWFLSATIVQNDLQDLFSVFCFLRFSPFNQRAIWKLVLPRDDTLLPGSPEQQRLQALLSCVLLRRTKDQAGTRPEVSSSSVSIGIPPKRQKLVKIRLSPRERAFYTCLWDGYRTRFAKLVRNGQAPAKVSMLLVMLLRLRQACSHFQLCLPSQDAIDEWQVLGFNNGPSSQRGKANGKHLDHLIHLAAVKACLKVEKKTDRKEIDEKNEASKQLELDQLSSSMKSLDLNVKATKTRRRIPKKTKTRGEHLQVAVAKNSQQEANPGDSLPVPVPLSPLSVETTAFLAEESGKVRFLMAHLKRVQEGDDPGAKTIVYSQWTSMLDLLQLALRGREIDAARLDGTMDTQSQETEVSRFKKEPTCCVFLISLKAGGVGLNLVEANHLILMDIWWNPAVEKQAIDRVHRIGQLKETFVYRLVVQDSIEERILALQNAKKKLSERAMLEKSRSGKSLSSGGSPNGLGLQELQRLFDLDASVRHA